MPRRRRFPRYPGTLTPAERRVLVQAISGHSNREVAQILHIAEATVKVHMRNIYFKLDIEGTKTDQRSRSRKLMGIVLERGWLIWAPGNPITEANGGRSQ
jgi:DNA-binding CsgD family transcriptional regulator